MTSKKCVLFGKILIFMKFCCDIDIFYGSIGRATIFFGLYQSYGVFVQNLQKKTNNTIYDCNSLTHNKN